MRGVLGGPPASTDGGSLGSGGGSPTSFGFGGAANGGTSSGSGSPAARGGSRSQPPSVGTGTGSGTGTTASDPRSARTSITLSDALYHDFPPDQRPGDVGGLPLPPYPYADDGGGNGYGTEQGDDNDDAIIDNEYDNEYNDEYDNDDSRTMGSYQTGSSHWGGSIFGGGAFGHGSVGGQSETQREEMLGELRQLLDGESVVRMQYIMYQWYMYRVFAWYTNLCVYMHICI